MGTRLFERGNKKLGVQYKRFKVASRFFGDTDPRSQFWSCVFFLVGSILNFR